MDTKAKPLHAVSADSIFRQLLAAELVTRNMTDDLKRLGYRWDAERGCYTHPNGTEVRRD
jgi:hypothetical protein